MSDLWRDFLTNEGRTICKWPHYFPIYERSLDALIEALQTHRADVWGKP